MRSQSVGTLLRDAGSVPSPSMETNEISGAFWAVIGAVIGAIATKIVELLIEQSRRNASVQLRVVGYDEVTAWGWSGEKLLRKLIELDRRVITDGLNDDREGTAEQWGPVFMAHPDSWALLIRGEREIVGYWHFAALDERSMTRARDGLLLDSEIRLENFNRIDLPGTYNLYFVLIGIVPEHKVRSRRLIEAFFDRLTSLAENGIFFREICANAFTEEGRMMCEAFKMRRHRTHQDFGTVYLRTFMPFPEELRGMKSLAKLIALYDDEYDRSLRH